MVSIVPSLVVEPKRRTSAASFNVCLVFLSTTDFIRDAVNIYRSALFYSMEWDGAEDLNEILKSFGNEILIEKLKQIWPSCGFALG